MNIVAENPIPVNEEPQVGNSKFVIFQEIEWPSTGGVDMDALPTKPVSVPLSRIRELRPAKTWKTWDNTVEIWTASDKRIAVRGTLDEIVAELNKSGNTRKPFALTKQGRTTAPDASGWLFVFRAGSRVRYDPPCRSDGRQQDREEIGGFPEVAKSLDKTTADIDQLHRGHVEDDEGQKYPPRRDNMRRSGPVRAASGAELWLTTPKGIRIGWIWLWITKRNVGQSRDRTANLRRKPDEVNSA